MARKTTLKEFKELTGITEWNDVIVRLERLAWLERKINLDMGYDTLADFEVKRANKYHDYLEKKGFYD